MYYMCVSYIYIPVLIQKLDQLGCAFITDVVLSKRQCMQRRLKGCLRHRREERCKSFCSVLAYTIAVEI